MKSRTLSSEKTFFKKNITRFLPFWALYILCLLLGLMILYGGEEDFYVVMNLGECARMMALVNCGYALLVAQLLFGDLFDSRMCSGIHCLPLRREEIFGLNILSGMLFSLVPTAIMALVSLPLMLNSQVVDAWQISFLWLLAANLQFLFFFGLAVFCVFLTGNRFSMAVVYGILNAWSLLLMLVIQSLYIPMLQGVSLNTDWCVALSPLVQIASSPLVIVSRLSKDVPGTFAIQPSWGYLWICAGIGLVLMVLALLLYRRRSLETAGEFIAVRPAKPVFLVIFAMVIASGFAVVSQEFFGYRERFGFGLVFAAVGLVVGWFVGCMLAEKSAHIFNKSNILRAVILLAVLLISFLLTWMDVLGIQSWTPDWEDVSYVRITEYYEFYGPRRYADEGLELPSDRLEDRESIERAIRLQELALQQNISRRQAQEAEEQAYTEDSSEQRANLRTTLSFSLEYTLENGRTVRRFYYIWNEGEAAELFSWLLSRPEVVLGSELQRDWGAGEDPLTHIRIDDVQVPEEYMTEKDLAALKSAIVKDCLEGRMAQVWGVHSRPIFVSGEDYYENGLYLEGYREGPGFWLNIYGESTHTLGWLQERGILSRLRDDWDEEIARREMNK